MKYLKKFESYVEADPINFENVFKITRQDIIDGLSYLLDEYDYLEIDLSTEDYDKFKIEIFEKELESDTTQNLDDEYRFFKKVVLDSFKSYIEGFKLNFEKERYNKETNRIIIEISRIK